MKTKQYVRAHAVHADGSKGEPIYFDVLIGDDHLAADGPIFGFEGDIDNSSGVSWPFIIRDTPGLNVDFGCECKVPIERMYESNVREQAIEKGNRFTWNGGGRKDYYEIKSVTVFLEQHDSAPGT